MKRIEVERLIELTAGMDKLAIDADRVERLARFAMEAIRCLRHDHLADSCGYYGCEACALLAEWEEAE